MLTLPDNPAGLVSSHSAELAEAGHYYQSARQAADSRSEKSASSHSGRGGKPASILRSSWWKKRAAKLDQRRVEDHDTVR